MKPTETRTPDARHQRLGTAEPEGGAGSLLQAANEHLVLAALRAQDVAAHAAAFRLLVESVKEYAIVMLDPNGLVKTWNAGAVRAFGYVADEILGRHLSVFYPVDDASARVGEADLDAAANDGRREAEGIRIRKDGSSFRANVILTALRNGSGDLVGFGVVTHDLSDRIRMEEARIELARIAEAERMKDEFLAIIGHELRNPLAPMVTAVHLLKRRNDPATAHELAVLDRQLSHMMRLVDDLLDISRSRQDKLRLARVSVEIGEVLANAVEMVRPLMESRRHHLDVAVPVEGLAVDADPARAAQIFVNLLTNAAKYTPPGGHIRARATAEGESVVVVVEDDGVGIAPALMPRVFDLFSQGEQALHREQGGLGLGLALAQRLVSAHGGEIEAHSDGGGRGSRFVVRLPRAAMPSSPRIAAAGVAVAVPRAGRSVLVVDDNQDSAEMLESLLQREGHTTRISLDGYDALAKAREAPPDFVILDIGLPGIDGFEVARRMRGLPGCAAIPILALSGYATDADRQKAFDAGCTAHFAKPVDVARLTRAVAELVGDTTATSTRAPATGARAMPPK